MTGGHGPGLRTQVILWICINREPEAMQITVLRDAPGQLFEDLEAHRPGAPA
jgi:hypothetical protein